MSKLSNKLTGEEKTVAKNYGALTVLQALNYILPFLIIPFLERQLGLEKFGLVMFAQSFMVFFVLVTDFGFNTTATREISLLKTQGADYSDIYFKVFWARIALIVLCFLTLLVLVFSIDKFKSHWELYLMSYGVVIGQAVFPVWFFQGIEKMKIITIVNVSAKVIFTFLMFLFIRSSQDYLKVPLYNSIGYLTAGVISFLFSLKFVKWKGASFKEGMNFYKSSFHMFISNLSSSLYTSLNAFLLGVFGGDVLVGIYTAFEKLILASKNMFIPIYQALYPFMARKSAKEKHILMKKLAITVAILGLIVCVVFICFAESILGLLFKDPLIIRNALLFKFMSSIAFFSGLSMLYNVLYLPANQQFKKLMKIMLFAGIFNAVLSLTIVPIFNIKGTVFAVVFTEFLLFAIAVYFYKNEVIKHNLNSTNS